MDKIFLTRTLGAYGPLVLAPFYPRPSERSVGLQMDFFVVSSSSSSSSSSSFTPPAFCQQPLYCTVLYCTVLYSPHMERPGPAKLILLKFICVETLTGIPRVNAACSLVLSDWHRQIPVLPGRKPVLTLHCTVWHHVPGLAVHFRRAISNFKNRYLLSLPMYSQTMNNINILLININEENNLILLILYNPSVSILLIHWRNQCYLILINLTSWLADRYKYQTIYGGKIMEKISFPIPVFKWFFFQLGTRDIA